MDSTTIDQNNSSNNIFHRKNYQKQLAFYCHYGHYVVHAHMVAFPTLALSIASESYKIKSLEQVLYFGFWLYLMFGLGSLPFGLLGDYWQRKIEKKIKQKNFHNQSMYLHTAKLWLLASSYLCIGVTSLFFCLPISATNSTFLIACLFFIGVGCSAYHPIGMSLLTQNFESKGKILGTNGIFGSLGVATAPLVASLLLIASHRLIDVTNQWFHINLSLTSWQMSMTSNGFTHSFYWRIHANPYL